MIAQLTVRLEEDVGLAGGNYEVKAVSSTRVALAQDSRDQVLRRRFLSFHPTEKGFEHCVRRDSRAKGLRARLR